MPEVCILGQILGASGFDSLDVFCKWRFEVGTASSGVLDPTEKPRSAQAAAANAADTKDSAPKDSANKPKTGLDSKWRVLHGDASGQTWIVPRKSSEELAVWNHPLDVTYACSTLSGWPKLLVEVYHTDEESRVDLCGYGWVHVPVAPGRHVREIAVFRPKGTLMQQIAAATLGGAPQYEHPNVIVSGDSRFGHGVVSCGLVHVDFHVVLKGFGPHIHAFGPTPLDAQTGAFSVCDGECPQHPTTPASGASASGSGSGGGDARIGPLTAASIGSDERLLAARQATAAARNAAFASAIASATPAVTLAHDGSVAARRDPPPASQSQPPPAAAAASGQPQPPLSDPQPLPAAASIGAASASPAAGPRDAAITIGSGTAASGSAGGSAASPAVQAAPALAAAAPNAAAGPVGASGGGGAGSAWSNQPA